jgi:hypothetical protein
VKWTFQFFAILFEKIFKVKGEKSICNKEMSFHISLQIFPFISFLKRNNLMGEMCNKCRTLSTKPLFAKLKSVTKFLMFC